MPVALGAKSLHGFDQPLELLNDCHRRIENFLGILLTVVEQADGKSLSEEQRRAVETALTYFQTAAPRHTLDEEQSLFPLLRASGQPRGRAAIAAVESLERDHTAANIVHAKVEFLYRYWIEAGSLDCTQQTELARILRELQELYRRHLDVEDREIFPLAAELLSKQQLTRVGEEMAERRGLSAKMRPTLQKIQHL